jgi:hypothetical protein
MKKRPRGPIFGNFPLILEAILMPVLSLRPSVMQVAVFTDLNLFGAIRFFQKLDLIFDLRHMIDNFCHFFRTRQKTEKTWGRPFDASTLLSIDP